MDDLRSAAPRKHCIGEGWDVKQKNDPDPYRPPEAEVVDLSVEPAPSAAARLIESYKSTRFVIFGLAYVLGMYAFGFVAVAAAGAGHGVFGPMLVWFLILARRHFWGSPF